MIRISLFWRTFVLLVLLVISSIGALMLVLRLLDNTPPEQRLAWEVASIVNLTRSALVSSQPERRITLLRELANEEGIRVLPLEAADEIEVTALRGRIALLAPRLQNLLGPETLVVSRVNSEEGLWVSFDIDEDKYWLQMQGRRIDRHFGPSAGLVLGIAGGLALLGSLALSRLINKPLADLARAIGTLGLGQKPAKLKEDLASEISDVNQRFNDMAADLAALEQDRAVTLAGISHDIRSPLARLRMEAEMAPLDAPTRESFVEDIERIDAIVGRFVDFARSGPSGHVGPVQVSDVLRQLPNIYRTQIQNGDMTLDIDAAEQLDWRGDHTDLERALGNLIDNALRYGRTAGTEHPRADISIKARRSTNAMQIELRDHGAGVPEDQLARLLRPFTRLDTARGGADGAGLGLAIVSRMARRYGGSFSLSNHPDGGLVASLVLPDARATQAPAPELVASGQAHLPGASAA